MAAELRSSWQDIVHPDAYAEHGYPHDVWTWMRANDPVYRWEQEEGIDFWAVTKRADIV